LGEILQSLAASVSGVDIHEEGSEIPWYLARYLFIAITALAHVPVVL
jgi:hypothetical protein